MDSSNAMRFVNVTDVVSVFASEQKTNEVFVTVVDSTGQFNIIVLHPAQVMQIHRLTIDAIVGEQENIEQDGN